MTDAEKIAMKIYPELWVSPSRDSFFKVDNNAGKRACAVDVAQHFLDIMESDGVVSGVMHAFYRREHGKEPSKEEAETLKTHMKTALLLFRYSLGQEL